MIETVVWQKLKYGRNLLVLRTLLFVHLQNVTFNNEREKHYVSPIVDNFLPGYTALCLDAVSNLHSRRSESHKFRIIFIKIFLENILCDTCSRSMLL